MDPELKELLSVLISQQTQTSKSVGDLAQTVDNLAHTVEGMAQTVDARMERIEENLDGLIRTIASEHSNGKPKPKQP